nr:MAG TPA: hypothetical protein [Caudoviricetes sp.]
MGTLVGIISILATCPPYLNLNKKSYSIPINVRRYL